MTATIKSKNSAFTPFYIDRSYWDKNSKNVIPPIISIFPFYYYGNCFLQLELPECAPFSIAEAR